MKARTFTTLGALHPVLFFAGVYIVALVFSIFICSSLFYSCQSNHSTKIAKEQKVITPVEKEVTTSTIAAGVVVR